MHLKKNTVIKAGVLMLIFVCLQLYSAFSQKPSFTLKQKVNIAIDFAGKNKTELQQVIDHYSGSARDSLKLKAAYFLIANMTGHFGNAGYQQQGVDSLIRYGLKAKQRSGSYFWQPGNAIRIARLWDSVMVYAAARHSGPDHLFDNKAITAKLLIENIDYAFKAWSLPWSRHLRFDEFCAYVLPYRFHDEPLESWRPRYMAKFSWLAKAMGKSTDPVLACRLINESLQAEFPLNRAFSRYGRALSPNNLLDGGLRNCLDQSGIANFAMRAMGIPVTLDVVFQWANRSFGHDFSSVMAKDGSFIPFMGAELPPYKYQLPYVAAKIYRINYAIQNDSLMVDEISTGTLPANFNHFRADATRQLIAVKDVVIPLKPGSVKPGEKVYLCVFDNRNWVPVCDSVSHDGKTAAFKDMGLGVLYLPMVLRDALTPVSPPVILQNDNVIKPVVVDKAAYDTITLSRKYPYRQRNLTGWR